MKRFPTEKRTRSSVTDSTLNVLNHISHVFLAIFDFKISMILSFKSADP